MSFHRIASLVLVIVAVTLAIIGAASAMQQKDETDEFYIPPEVKDLLVQRLEILRERERHVLAGREVGHKNPVEVLKATQDRLAGELELAESRDARLEILRRQVDAARELEKLWQQIADVGRADLSDVLEIRLGRLAAEIDLARETRKAGRRQF